MSSHQEQIPERGWTSEGEEEFKRAIQDFILLNLRLPSFEEEADLWEQVSQKKEIES